MIDLEWFTKTHFRLIAIGKVFDAKQETPIYLVRGKYPVPLRKELADHLAEFNLVPTGEVISGNLIESLSIIERMYNGIS